MYSLPWRPSRTCPAGLLSLPLYLAAIAFWPGLLPAQYQKGEVGTFGFSEHSGSIYYVADDETKKFTWPPHTLAQINSTTATDPLANLTNTTFPFADQGATIKITSVRYVALDDPIQGLVTIDSGGSSGNLNPVTPPMNARLVVKGTITVPFKDSQSYASIKAGSGYNTAMCGTETRRQFDNSNVFDFTWDSGDCPQSSLSFSSSGPVNGIYTIQRISSGWNVNVNVYFYGRIVWMTLNFTTNFVPAGKPTLAIDHVEVVQTVQDESNSVNLVSGKKSVARVYVKSMGANAKPIKNLKGCLSASEASGPPLCGTIVSLSVPDAVASPPPLDRNQPASSMIFQIPDDWTQLPGQKVHLHADVSALGVTTDPSNNPDLTVTFDKPPNWPDPLRIGYVRVCQKSPDDNQLHCPADDISLAGDPVKWLFPLKEKSLIYAPALIPKLKFEGGYLGTSDWLAPERLMTTLSKIYLIIQMSMFADITGKGGKPVTSSGTDMLVAWLPKITDGATGVLLDLDTYFTDSDGTLKLPLLRNLWNRYPIWWMSSACEPRENPTSLNPDCDGNDLSFNSWRLSRGLGMMLGLDPTPGGKTGDTGFNTGRRNPFVVKDSAIDFMAMPMYVPPINSTVGISPNHAQSLWTQTYFSASSPGSSSSATAARQPRVRPANAVATDLAVVSGTIQTDGSSATIDPVYRLTASYAPPPSDPNGAYCLRYFTATADPLDYCFTPQSPPRNGRGNFVIAMPLPANATRLALVANNAELSSVSAASGPAHLTIIAPTASDRWEGTHTVSWSASDPDGNALTYSLLYSSDNGASWLPLAVDLRTTQYELDCSQIGGGNQVLLRVIASSGLTNTSATAGPFEVVQHPQLTASQTALDFGNVTIGKPVQQSVVLRNSGSGPLNVTAALSGAAGFTLLDSLDSQLIPASGQFTLGVQFSPSAAGTANAALTITGDDAGQSSVKILLTGAGFSSPVPNISVAPQSLDFGTVASGQTKDLKFTVSNSGPGALTVNSASSNNPRFSTAAVTFPVTIAPGAQQDITLRFAPTAAGALSATLTVASDDPTHVTVTVALTGTGAGGPAQAPSIDISPATLDFGSVAVNQTKDLSVTVRNSGNAALSVTSIAFDNAAYTLVSPSGSFQVAAGASQVLTVRFAPKSAATVSAKMSLTSNDPTKATSTVSLTGTGTSSSGGTSGTISVAGYWKFDEAGGTKAADSSGNNNTGTLSFGAAFAPGKSGTAVNIDGSSGYVAGSGPGAAFPIGNSARTIAAWIKMAPAAGTDRSILHYGTDGNGPATNYHLAVNGSGLAVIGNGFGNGTIQTTARVDDNTWHHLAAVYEGTSTNTARIYIDGVQQASGTLSQAPNTGTGTSWRIGMFLNGNGSFPGLLDEVKLYSGALTAAQVQSLYTELPSTASPTIAVSPSSLDFGTVTVGQTKDLSLTVRNTGTASLSVTAPATDNAVYSVTSPSGAFQIAAGASQTVTLRFTPKTTSSVAAKLTLTSNDPSNKTVTVNLTGAGAVSTSGMAEAALSPGWDDFSVPLSSGRVLWSAVTASSGQLNFQATFELHGAPANRRFNAGVHFFEPAGNPQPDITQFGGTQMGGRSQLSRESVTTTILTAYDFGALTTDSQGNALATFSYTVPNRSYYMQFTVRAGDCPGVGGSSCAAVFRTGQKMGTNFETINGSSGGSTGGTPTVAGYWKFDEGAGTKAADSSGNGNTGTLSYGAAFVTGKIGSAVNIDGSSGFVAGAGPGTGFPVGSAARTIAAWIKMAPAAGTDRAVLHYGTDGGSGPGNYHLAIDGNGLVVIGNGWGFGIVSSKARVDDNTWHHLAAVYEGSATNTARIYIDGVQQTSGTLATVPNTGTGSPWRIGMFLNGRGSFPGLLDEVKLYSGALTASQVQSLYTDTGSGSTASGTVYKLARIDVVRTFIDPAWGPQNIGVLPAAQSLAAGERNFQLGWEFLWGTGNANRNRASALVTLTSVPSTVTPGAATSALAASMTGNWYTSGGYGIDRDHTISLDGSAGQNQWSTVQNPNGAYNGTFTTSKTPLAPAANSSGEVVLPLTAKLNFGGDHYTIADIRLVYTVAGTGPTPCTYNLAATGATFGSAATSGSLSVTSAPAACQWAAVVASGSWITLTSGLNYSGVATVRYQLEANTGALRTGTLTVAGQTFTITQSAPGGGTTNPGAIFTDSFSRTASDICALGAADNALGGTSKVYYLPLWPLAGATAVGATIANGWLTNQGLNYGGVMFASGAGCGLQRGDNLGQSLDISMDVIVPSAGGLVTQAGPFFRSRAATAGDGIIGGSSAGFWVQLHSTGEVKVKQLNPQSIIASSPAISGFDASAVHQLRATILGTGLTVTLDGKQVITATAGVTSGNNDGAAGIAFGAEPNAGKIGGQKVRNLVVQLAGGR